MYAPVCLFTYNRLGETKETVEALSKNFLAQDSMLIIFSDGPKRVEDIEKVAEVRNYLKQVSGFKTIKIIESEVNQGLANSIIGGVTKVLKEYHKVIVVEDDLISAPNFLNFMNEALDFYEDSKKVFSISGFTMQLKSLPNYQKDYYLSYRSASWGWATWQDRWEAIDWEVKDYSRFKWNLVEQWRFMRGGSDLPLMLWKQMNGYLDSWAIRWTYHQFRNDLYSVRPSRNKIVNIGTSGDATHTKKLVQRHVVELEEVDQTDFQFDSVLVANKKIINESKYMHSFFNRLVDRLRVLYSDCLH
ncbi:sugar transferase [Mangrovibacterium sp.]|uniref:sugar transferase n=1 Tax=Mangrovibacterium sp. TaxID=1961364 RepID=UPI00356A34E7